LICDLRLKSEIQNLKSKMIRVLVADSSSADIDIITKILSTDPEIEVTGVATTGKQAMDLVSKLRPDILTISDSLEGVDSGACDMAIKQIMAYNPTPILILTAPDSGGAKAKAPYARTRKDSVFKATSLGALDVIEKPMPVTGDALPATRLVETVKLLSKVKVVTHLAGKLEKNRRYPMLDNPPSTIQKLVAIAASTGGPSALAEVLRGLPAELRIAVVIVQHVAEGFSAGLAEWLDRESQITVREARDGDAIEYGCALVSPTGFHMMVKPYASGNRIMLEKTPPVAGHRPSADILFTSVAETYGPDSIGVILTGMGSDGARGIVAIKNAGGKTIAQDEQSCVVFGMPKAAIETGVVDEILPLDSIAEEIVRLCRKTAISVE
jgi:two-component system chemotaxis response regulator CheB